MNIYLPYPSTSVLRNPGERTYPCKDCTGVSIVTLFRIVQDWKQPNLPNNPLGKWVKKIMIYSYNGALLLLLLSRLSRARLCATPRLPHPWDSPGKNTGVGCHFLLQCMKVKSESEVAQSYSAIKRRINY